MHVMFQCSHAARLVFVANQVCAIMHSIGWLGTYFETLGTNRVYDPRRFFIAERSPYGTYCADLARLTHHCHLSVILCPVL